MRGAGSKNAWALFLLIWQELFWVALSVCLQKGFQHLAGFLMDRLSG